MIVDDEDRNRRLLEAILIPFGYDVIMANNGKEALDRVLVNKPDVILLDIMMPVMDGFEAARRLKDDEKTRIIPIVMVTALKDVESRVKALEVGVDDFLNKPVDKLELRARIKSLLKVKAYYDHMCDYQRELEVEIAKRTAELKKAYEKIKDASLETIYRLSRAAEYKDEDTGKHLLRISQYSTAIARKIGMDNSFLEAMLYASPMHDVGKIGIPDRILLKPGKLEPEEWKIMKRHTIIGGEILEGSDAEFIKLARIIALTHHEKWDGSGYPEGLKKDEIPIAGRIISIVDVFDALTTRRPYKEAFSFESASKIILEKRGYHFDPDIADVFFSIKDQILDIKLKFTNKKTPPIF